MKSGRGAAKDADCGARLPGPEEVAMDLVAPTGRFRVIGVDTFPGSEGKWLVGDFDTLDEAKKVAARKREESTGSGGFMRFNIYDDRGRWVGEG